MTCDHYLEQANSNEKAAHSLEKTYPDWAVTICFYAALHWVEYYASVTGCDIEQEYPGKSPHESRRDYVRELASQLRNNNLRNAYLKLEEESRKARYLQGLTTDAKVYYTKNNFKVIDSFQNLQKIRVILSS
ncbi:hypothetical protein [aff. Roholtiella sp. LEGE 12411]|uniref:hypothetical protein n=1 Tax=aff. Roholtiella sp. LEGE 12411 TaxID=1828822 RepID=UPI001881E3D3|nr:hypothetical protein [aff. Roholtiella sp. LEGE 12411]MBE9037154.1 hypothetical protein [aff. Roholtiella sp. LEGE 12411]